MLVGARLRFGVKSLRCRCGHAGYGRGVIAIASHGEWSRLATFAFNWRPAAPARLRLLRVLHFGAARHVPRFRGSACSPRWLRRAGDLDPADDPRDRTGRFVWPTPLGLVLLVYAALGPAFIAQVFYMRGVQLIGPGRAGVFVNLVPLFGALMAILLLGEPFAAYHLLALSLVVGGIAIAQRAPASNVCEIEAQSRRDRKR